MVFTEAHSGSSVCTPTRYGILTGRYAWRTRLQAGVLMGESPHLITPDRLTVAKLLREHGYSTACLGKWHLGMDWTQLPAPKKTRKKGGTWNIDYTKPVVNGPTAVGFDYYFGVAASLDMPPFTFIENDRVVKIPTVEKKWVRTGPAAEDFDAIDTLPTLGARAVDYIAKHADASKHGTPFFLYLPLTSPHTPLVPSKEWQGKNLLGPYGDFVMESDEVAGKVLKSIDDAGIADNTLVIFTSDNGCAPYIGVKEMEEKGHFASADRRGYKADIWDGGHHVPFIARWPGKVAAGSSNNTLTCLTDLLATCAEITGAKLPDNAGEDSVSILSGLLARADAPKHEAVVHHSIQGKFAIRQGNWKLELCPGSGGWSSPKDGEAVKQGLPPVQLYEMSGDVAEAKNVQTGNVEIVTRLTKLLEKYVADGRSTPGAPQKNDVEVDIWKKKPKLQEAEKE